MTTLTVPATHDLTHADELVPGDFTVSRGRWLEIFQTRIVGDYVWLRFYDAPHTDVVPRDDMVPVT